MQLCDFVHLHTHSEDSTLDGMSKLRELFETAKSLGQNALAITDHGSMSGLWEAQKVADEFEMKMIHGCEFYWEYSEEAESAGAKGNGHLLILAKNDVGLENMFKMHAWACKENFKRNPRITWEVLYEHREGLIVTTACLGSEFNQFIMAGEVNRARDFARKFKAVFGEDFYIELQPNGMPEQHLCNETGIRIAKELGIEVVATNDVHYTLESDCFPHEVLLAMQVRKKMSDEKRFKLPAEAFWLKSEEEMVETFEGLDSEVVQNAIENTGRIASKCDARIEKGHFLPHYHTIPEGETERSLLARNIMEGLAERDMKKDREFVKDVQYELNVVDGEGYSGYFLIVEDYVTSAKKRGELVGEGRGSGAGSKIAYTTGITEIPPHEYDLLFERFMAKGREPDFDTDFSDQQAVFRDLQEKYGVDNVARIIAFAKMTPKNVARKVLGVFDHPMSVLSEVTKLIPDGTKDLFEEVERSPELKALSKKYHTEFDVMRRLQGVTSHVSQHAGGVIIYPGLASLVPLGWDRENKIHIAGWDMDMLAELGHHKFDILGLETLPVLHGALQSLSEAGIHINLASIDYEDQEVYDMLCAGDVSGVFQLSAQATKVMQQQPRNFRDIIAINALIRPGVGDWDEYLARRKGKPYDIYEPRKPYMEETVGTMTYQEQYLLDAHVLAGWGIAYADKHIRKNRDIRNDEGLRRKFIDDCTARGHAQEVAEGVWSEIEDAVDGGYGFNKSHSASYGRTSYQTAYLKAKHPEHYYASLMSGEKTDGDGQNAIAGYIAECKQRNINILPPDINLSDDKFFVANGGIGYRITTIKHVGDSAIEHIRELRPIASFDDFLARREKKSANKAVVTNLIKAGAFDFDEPNRAHLLWKFAMSERTKTQIKEDYQCEAIEWNDNVKCEWEKEVLGMYLSLHPMEKYGFKPLDEFQEGGYALQGGEVSEVYEFHPQRNPEKPKMAFVTINTLFGHVKLVVFHRQWAQEDTQEALQKGNLVLVRGKRSGNDVLLDSVEVLE